MQRILSVMNFNVYKLPVMQKKQYDAFLCYSRQDFDVNKVINATLADAGISTFSYYADLAGGYFEYAIVNNIKSLKLVRFLYTSHSIHSNWIMNQVHMLKI